AYSVELMDVDVDHNKAWFEVSLEGEVIESFWMVLDPLHGFSPNLQQQGASGEVLVYGIDLDGDGVADDYYYNKWITGRAEKDVWGDYQWKYYVDNRGDAWYLFTITDFVLDGVKIFIGAQGTIGIEIKVYWLENKKVFYNHLCCDPWVTEANNYQMFLDAYESGWDAYDVNGYYLYQPPGTGFWPQDGLAWWTLQVGPANFIGDGFLDNNDGHIGYEWTALNGAGFYFPEQDNLDRDDVAGVTTFNDGRDMNWVLQAGAIDLYDIEDPVLWFGAGQPIVEINIALCDKMCAPGCEYKWPIPGPYPRDPPYFTIEVTDVLFGGLNGMECPDFDGIYYDTIMEAVQTTTFTTVAPADIDEIGIVMLDTELDFAGWKAACEYNLVLIGGPVANIVVKQLVDEGVSTVDWTTSPGEWEYITDPYGDCDILIIAGADRDATREAAQDLIDQL
ncbi:MAG: S-layer protein, partial [Theionarchaea archaeon]|nr:S-layer protein [Theionarchaea archaeon]